MAEQEGDLIDRNARQQHLDRKSIPEHVGMTAFRRSVGLRHIDQFEEAAVAALPIGDRTLRLPIAAPEEVTRIWLWTGGHVLKGLNHKRRKRHVDRRSGLGLVEQKTIALKPMSFQSDRVADTKPAPAHQ